MTQNLEQSVSKLCRLSREQFAPLPSIEEWPEQLTPERDWYFSPDLMSLAGTSQFAQFDEATQKRLSFYETINFFSLNIHGERYLVAGMAERLYGSSHRPEYEYLHHFLDEENKHLNYFGTFCHKFAGKVYADRKLGFGGQQVSGEQDYLFFLRVLVFEEVADFVNVHIAADPRVLGFVRQLHRMHHQDEVRHLAFGRLMMTELHEEWWPRWDDAVRARVSEYASQYLTAIWSEYYCPDMYRDAGLDNCYELSRLARTNGARVREEALRKPRQFLVGLGVISDP